MSEVDKNQGVLNGQIEQNLRRLAIRASEFNGALLELTKYAEAVYNGGTSLTPDVWSRIKDGSMRVNQLQDNADRCGHEMLQQVPAEYMTDNSPRNWRNIANSARDSAMNHKTNYEGLVKLIGMWT